MASKGQRTAHNAQPVHSAGLSRWLCFFMPWTCNDSTCGPHTATHQPQPVQRLGSMTGKAFRAVLMQGLWV